MTATRGSKVRVRNMAKVKLLKTRPEHLLPKTRVTQGPEYSSDEEDWLDMTINSYQLQPAQNPAQPEPDLGEQEAGREEQDRADLEKEVTFEPIAARKAKRTRKEITRLGIDAKSSSPTKRDRKKKQGEARKRAKEVWVFQP